MTEKELNDRVKKLEDALRERNREIERLRGALDESRATLNRLMDSQLKIDLYKGEG